MQSSKLSLTNFTIVHKQFTRLVTTTYNHEITCEPRSLKSWKDIPGPSSLPVIKQLHHFLPGGHLHKPREPLASVLFKKYGPIVRFEGFLGSKPTVFIFDAEAASYILRSENTLPIRSSIESLEYFRKVYNKKVEDPDNLTGLITEQGENWKKIRSAVNSILLQPKTVKLYNTSLNVVADDMIKRMKQIRDDKNMLQRDLISEMNLWALESVGVVALGGRLNCLDLNLPDDSPAKKMIQAVHDILEANYDLDLTPSLWRYISTPAFKRGMKTYGNIITLNKYFIQKAIDEYKSKDKNSDNEKGVLEKLLEINVDIAEVMASDMLFAGIDTTANTVISVLYLLARSPEKQEKLRAEIVSGQDKRPYLKACIKESLRMMPIIAGSLRTSSKEYNILGYKIPKDVQIVMGHQILSLLDEHYPRANEFLPERWTAEKSDELYYGHAHPFAYSPFGFGVRSCIGRRIAELEIEIFVAKLMKNFHLEWVGPPMVTQSLLINYPVPPFNFIFRDIK